MSDGVIAAQFYESIASVNVISKVFVIVGVGTCPTGGLGGKGVSVTLYFLNQSADSSFYS